MLAFLGLSLLLLLSGCATSGSNEDVGMSINDTVIIKPSGSYEDCIEVLPGQIMNYSFNASNFVSFNVHYHTETGIYYPVNKKGVMFGKESLDPQKLDYYTDEQESFCVMWDNLNSEPVKVSFKANAESS
jgi:hypothetical protein